MKVLITGANGFLGSHLSLLWTSISSDTIVAGVRKGANLETIQGLVHLSICFFDYYTEQSIAKSLLELKKEHGTFDIVVHNAGLTKSTEEGAFFKVNLGITDRLIQALKSTSFLDPSGKLVYVSSLAALGPHPFTGPVSEYGLSKLAAENVVKDSGYNYLIFRPTGLYGPFDLEFLPLFKTVKFGFYPSLAPKNQKITLIHGSDAAMNLINITKMYQNQTVHLVSDEVYSHRSMHQALNFAWKRRSLFIVVPQWIVKTLIILAEKLSGLIGRKPFLTLEKYKEISGDWNPELLEERKLIPLEFNYTLNRGFSDTLAFYKTKKLI